MRAILLALLLLPGVAWADQLTTRDRSVAFPRFAGSPIYAGLDCAAGPISTAGAGEMFYANSGGAITADTSPFSNGTDYPYGTCLYTVTASTDRAYIGTNFVAARFGKGACRFHARIYLDTLSDGTDTYDLRLGFLDSNSTASVDGAYLHYSSASNGGEWEAITVSNSTSTGSVTDTNSLVAATTVYIIDIEVNEAGNSAVFKVNGTTVATNTTNIPTGTSRDFGWGVQVNKSLGAGAKTLSVDYFEGTCTPTTARG